MQNRFESFVRALYLSWKKDKKQGLSAHPETEELLCFIEGRLNPAEASKMQEHLIHCDDCMEKVCASVELGQIESFENVPEAVLEKVRSISESLIPVAALDICLQIKNEFLELIRATGDVLLGQELIPALVLRSRSLKEFRDNVTILKDFDDIRIKTKIESRPGKELCFHIYVSYKDQQKPLKNIRVSLFRGDLELESYIIDGSAVFEHLSPGSYKIMVSDASRELAVVLLEIKV